MSVPHNDVPYLKIPVEMAQFALRGQKYKKVRSYTASHFLCSGKARISERPARRLSDVLQVSETTVYRHFNWLLDRNWMGKDEDNGWFFFRGLDRVHKIENWQFARAAIMFPKDLETFKAFLAGVVCASLAITREGQRTGQHMSRNINRSEPPAALISLSVLADTLDISMSTAQRIRNLADECNYIQNEPTLIEITNWTPNQLVELKSQDISTLPVRLFGRSGIKNVAINRIRYEDGKLKLQEPNSVKALIPLKSRRGLSKYQPLRT